MGRDFDIGRIPDSANHVFEKSKQLRSNRLSNGMGCVSRDYLPHDVIYQQT